MASPLRALSSRFVSRVLFVILVLFLIRQLHSFHQSVSPQDISLEPSLVPCEPLRGINDVFVVLKSGATEALEKVPIHFNTTLRCIPHYVVYSDLTEEIDGHPVYDALEDVDEDIKANHPEFEVYRRLHHKGREAFAEGETAGWAAAANTAFGRDNPAWKLDKWKFLPMAEKAYRRKPDAKWYVFFEADSYILWKSLLDWLSHMDPSRPLYLGQQMQIAVDIFAYGGAGFVVSQPALKAVVERRQKNLKFYDDFTSGHWAGDCVLGKALNDVGVPVRYSWPNLFGEKPSNMDYNATFSQPDVHPWCYHVASYHHMTPYDMEHFYRFEQDWNREVSATIKRLKTSIDEVHVQNAVPLRHRDVFQHYMMLNLRPERSHWDNLSDQPIAIDSDGEAVRSFEQCRMVCESQQDCLQFSFGEGTCKISNIVRMGQSPADGSMDSGWMMDRITDYVEAMDATCNGEDWLLP